MAAINTNPANFDVATARLMQAQEAPPSTSIDRD
jgi:hypothetical protein